MALVLFHRNFQRFQGGHMKVFHYFEHVRSAAQHSARIRFTADSVWDETNPWFALPQCVLAPEEHVEPDVLFLAGADWRSLSAEQRERPPVPIVNLVQDFRAVREAGSELQRFLRHRAVRVCVTEQLAQAIEAAGANGPVLTIPIGIDLAALPPPRAPSERDIDCALLATKEPALGAKIARRLERRGHRVELIDRSRTRAELLDALARARVAVLLPASVEGAYMPALESMALGAAVVCPDCVGNRSFCRDGDTCLVPRRSARSLAAAAHRLLRAPARELEPMLARARVESSAHALELERERFLELLSRLPELWASSRAGAV